MEQSGREGGRGARLKRGGYKCCNVDGIGYATLCGEKNRTGPATWDSGAGKPRKVEGG